MSHMYTSPFPSPSLKVFYLVLDNEGHMLSCWDPKGTGSGCEEICSVFSSSPLKWTAETPLPGFKDGKLILKTNLPSAQVRDALFIIGCVYPCLVFSFKRKNEVCLYS